MDMISNVNFWRELVTVGGFALFAAITVWAYSRKRKGEFTQVSEFVVQDDDTAGFEERSR